MTGAAQEPFGARLRRLREARGLKLTTLAMRVGLTEAAIRQLEIGRTREPRLADGMRLADALGADPRYLAFVRARTRARTWSGGWPWSSGG